MRSLAILALLALGGCGASSPDTIIMTRADAIAAIKECQAAGLSSELLRIWATDEVYNVICLPDSALKDQGHE